jgi:prepilin-type N-terminal cleavage/methylation domain-containing protein
MRAWRTKDAQGFTIVELLIVIVVIAILAAISMVAYTGIQERARASTLMSALTQAAKMLEVWRVENSDQYPSSLSDIGVSDTEEITYQYTYDNNVSTFCITATYGDALSYYVSNSTSSQPGVCSGYNIIAWNKNVPSTMSVPSATADTSTFRTSTASMRFGPSQVGREVRGSPFTVSTGQTYTVKLWVKTDTNWNGTSSNSKIRFGNATSGGNALIKACSYQGVKTSWTQYTCGYTVEAGVTKLIISVGNDGTTGNIWIDDMSLVVT